MKNNSEQPTVRKPGEKEEYETPSLSLLVKLGSIAVHVDEFFSHQGHHFDKAALDGLLADKQVKKWIKSMGALLPVKRGT